MLYNKEEHSRYVMMAGRISIAASIIGFAVFMVAFMVDVGSQEISQRVSAQQTASTTLTVLNTPPAFTVEAYEATQSSSTNPTNSGDEMRWEAVGEDSNSAPYFLLICSTNATPTPQAAANLASLGTAAPECGAGAIQWAVSTSTVSGELAFAATTTEPTATSQFDEQNDWYAWVCDDDPFLPRCNDVPTQGVSATSSSPFFVNNRPNFTVFSNDGPVDPGGSLTFQSTSSDPDTVGGNDTVTLVVCAGAGDYNTTTNDCDSNFLASTTIPVTADASAVYTLPAIVQDQLYNAHGFIVDEHGHEASSNPIAATFTVNNVAPEILGGDILLQDASSTLVLAVPGGETTGFTLDFTVRDANSCLQADNITSEISDSNYVVSLYRDDLQSTSTCDGVTGGQYDPNHCYTTAEPQSVWNLDCTASTTQCTSNTQDALSFECTFPLWFVADPTDNGPQTPAAFESDIWSVAVAGVDNDNATGTMTKADISKDIVSFTALELLTEEIVYGALEPGQNTASFNPTTTVLSVGNTGLDQEVRGESMCDAAEFALGLCSSSPTSTIPAAEQEFSSSPFAYTAGTDLASTTNQEVELNVAKTTSTTTPNNGITYWGIAVPASIQLAGNYTGLNTFVGVVSEAGEW